jgi:hypothetical protein
MAQDLFDQLHAAVKQAESQGQRYDTKGNLLTSPKGAQGEMQVMPKTAKDPGFGVAPAKGKDPDDLARVGKDYLKAMVDKYGDTQKAVIAYNWGPGNTDKWLASGADPKALPAETQGYVARISKALGGDKLAPITSSGPTESEKTMTKALQSGMSAQNLVKDAGPGYKAAMAMMFLADDKPEAPDEDIWKEAEAPVEEEDATPNALAGLDLGYQSPFPTQSPQQPTQQVARLASGGIPFVPRAVLSGTARDQLQAVKGQWDDYNTQATGYNDALEKWKTETYAPYETALNAYNTAAEEYNKGPRTEDFTLKVPETIQDFSMAAPTAPKVSQEEFQAQAAAANASLRGRQMGIDAFTDPDRFNLSINRHFAEGGEASSAEDLAGMMPSMEDATPAPFMAFKSASKQTIGDKDLENMMVGLGTNSATLGVNLSNMRQGDKDNLAQSLLAAYRQQMGDINLNVNAIRPVNAPPGIYAGNLSAGIPVGNRDQLMVGINGLRTPEESKITGYNVGYSGEVGPGRLNAMMMQPKDNPKDRSYQVQYQIPFKADGGIVYRADGSPETGELTQAEIEAASRPAFLTPKSGIGRTAGPISQALASGEAYPAVARGIAETPYNVVGSFADIGTLALRPFGYKEEKPIMGSDWIKEKMTKLGIRPGEETDPTLKGFRTAGELGSSVVNPGPIAAKVGQATEKGAAFLGKETARQMLKGINGEGVLAPFSPTIALPIVRPSGGLFPTSSVTKENGTWITEQPKSNLDLRWSPVLDDIVDNTAELGEAKTDAMMEMFGQKLKSYYSKQAGGPNDPLRTALFSGRVKFDEASELNDMFPKALIEAAKKKDITSLRLLEKKYDDMIGIQGNYFQRESDQTLRRDLGPDKTSQLIMEQMKNNPEVVSDDMLLRYARKDFSEMNPQQMKIAADEIRAKIKENPERFSTVLEPNVERTLSPQRGEMVYESSTRSYPNQYPLAYSQQDTMPDLSVQTGIDKGQPLFDVKHPESFLGSRPLLGMDQDELVEAAKQIDPKELSRMSFPEFVLRAHNDNLSTQTLMSRAPEIEKAIKAGNPMPKDLSDFGVREFLPTLNDYRWMEITNPAATTLQAKAMNNSIAGYARSGAYGSLNMGKAGMDRGAVRLFALYDPTGTPVTHVEYITDKVKTVKPENANKANTITQFYGNGPLTGNVAPNNYVEQVSDLVDKLDVVDLPYSIKNLMRANGKFATGGAVERVHGDNRRYL